MDKVASDLIVQATNLLAAIPDAHNNLVYYVNFNDTLERIEVWDMLADDERMVAFATYQGA